MLGQVVGAHARVAPAPRPNSLFPAMPGSIDSHLSPASPHTPHPTVHAPIPDARLRYEQQRLEVALRAKRHLQARGCRKFAGAHSAWGRSHESVPRCERRRTALHRRTESRALPLCPPALAAAHLPASLQAAQPPRSPHRLSIPPPHRCFASLSPSRSTVPNQNPFANASMVFVKYWRAPSRRRPPPILTPFPNRSPKSLQLLPSAPHSPFPPPTPSTTTAPPTPGSATPARGPQPGTSPSAARASCRRP